MNLVGILQQPRIRESMALGDDVRRWLTEHGVASWMAAPWDDEAIAAPLHETDLVIVLGGDGSTLRAARWTVPYNVPIFGINVGRVGFLSEATPDDWPDKLERVLRGQHWLERRLLLHAELWRDDALVQPFMALNEVVIGRGSQARVIRLHLRVDDDLVTTYIADALIVATPTGSTAYALSAGGPLLHPMVPAWVLVPIAPHTLSNRPIVLADSVEIAIEIVAGRDASASFDMQSIASLHHGDRIVVRRSEHRVRLLHPRGWSYFDTLREKLHWNEGGS